MPPHTAPPAPFALTDLPEADQQAALGRFHSGRKDGGTAGAAATVEAAAAEEPDDLDLSDLPF